MSKYFVYAPEQGGFKYFHTERDALKAMEKEKAYWLEDAKGSGEWNSLAETTFMGRVTREHWIDDSGNLKLVAIKDEELDRLGGFCKEFVFGEDNPEEYQSEIDKRDAEIERLKVLLTLATCPACDGSGVYYDNYGELEQCQWCYEREQAIQPNTEGEK